MSDFYTWIIILVVLVLIWRLLVALHRIQREDTTPKRKPPKKRRRKRKSTQRSLQTVDSTQQPTQTTSYMPRICATPGCERPAVETLCRQCSERQNPPLRFPTQKDFGHYG